MIMELMRYALQLEMVERRSELDDDAAIGLLRGELARVQSAGYFDDLSAEDLAIGTITRTAAQQDATRYGVDLLLEERNEDLGVDRVHALIRRAFADAMNASYFLRVSRDDQIAVSLAARGPSAVSSPA